MSGKILESFKSVDFDADFFVLHSTAGQAAQLDACVSQIQQELRQVVKESNQTIINTAQACETTTGELLSLREQLGPLRQTVDTLCSEEQTRLSNLKAKHAQLAQCLEAARVVRKLAKLQMDATKLRALFPTDNTISSSTYPDLVNKVSMVLGPAESEDFFEDYKELQGILLAQEDLQLLRKLCAAFRNCKK